MNLKPQKDCVIVRPNIERHEFFALPTSRRTGTGKVIAVGSTAQGYVNVGDTVLFGEYVGQEFDNDGEKLLVMRESHILGVVDE